MPHLPSATGAVALQNDARPPRRNEAAGATCNPLFSVKGAWLPWSFTLYPRRLYGFPGVGVGFEVGGRFSGIGGRVGVTFGGGGRVGVTLGGGGRVGVGDGFGGCVGVTFGGGEQLAAASRFEA